MDGRDAEPKAADTKQRERGLVVPFPTRLRIRGFAVGDTEPEPPPAPVGSLAWLGARLLDGLAIMIVLAIRWRYPLMIAWIIGAAYVLGLIWNEID